MASYHFRIKSDTKSNGDRVSASVHVDYIARQGRYKNKGREKNVETNFIEFDNSRLGEETFLLYNSDDFGKIFSTPKGLQISGKYSETTLSIAMKLAQKISDNRSFRVKGSGKFKEVMVRSAADFNLDFQFFNRQLRHELEFKNEVNKMLGRKITEQQRTHSELVSKEILEKLEGQKRQVSAVSHLEYINREQAYAKRGDCIFTAHQLPKWAEENPKNFFEAADKYEGKNRRRYVEIEFSLPNELKTIEDYKKIIEPFLKKHLQNHYYTYAIHEKPGAISGERHPHVHIMFSERLIDEVEKTQEREPQNYFKYPARRKKDGSEPTFEEKIKLGAPKDKKWNQNSKYIYEMREDMAKIQNEVLAEQGFSARVDHRSLKEQKAEAERRGDLLLAKILDREPEKYVTHLPLDEKNPHLKQLKKQRADRQTKINKLYSADLISRQEEENKNKKVVRDTALSSVSATKISDSNSEQIPKLKAEVERRMSEVTKLKRSFISIADARQLAQAEYMTKAEKAVWQNFHDTKFQIDNLKIFLGSLPQGRDDDIRQQEIVAVVEFQIKNLEQKLKSYQPDFDLLTLKLNSATCKNNINYATRKYIKQNESVRRNLLLATEKLNDTTEKLRDSVLENDQLKETMRLQEVFEILRREFFTMTKERENLCKQKSTLAKKLISTPRAYSMAQNIFVQGGYKKLREDKRRFEKQRKNLYPNDQIKIQKELRAEENRLTELCSPPQAQVKILEIAAGILRKNEKVSNQISNVDQQIEKLDTRLAHLKLQIGTVQKMIPRMRTATFRFDFAKFNKPTNSKIAAAIADALLKNLAVGVNAAITRKGFDMDVDFELADELTKDKIKKDVGRMI